MNALTGKMECWNASQCSDSYRWCQLLPVEPVLLWARDVWFVATGKWKRGLPAGPVTCPLLFCNQNCIQVWTPFFFFFRWRRGGRKGAHCLMLVTQPCSLPNSWEGWGKSDQLPSSRSATSFYPIPRKKKKTNCKSSWNMDKGKWKHPTSSWFPWAFIYTSIVWCIV